jgi:hypothetical protein
METSIKFYYDNETHELVAQRYFINGEEVSAEDFEDVSGDQVEILDEEADIDFECEGNCDQCEFGEEDETISDIIEDYKDMIIATEGCESCIQRILEEFFEEIVNLLEE